jgi:hypothetical protein
VAAYRRLTRRERAHAESRPPLPSGSLPPLRAPAHRVGHFVAGNAVPIAEFLKLFEVKLFRHLPQRVVSRLRVTESTQDINQPLPAIRHLNPQAPSRYPYCRLCANATASPIHDASDRFVLIPAGSTNTSVMMGFLEPNVL